MKSASTIHPMCETMPSTVTVPARRGPARLGSRSPSPSAAPCTGVLTGAWLPRSPQLSPQTPAAEVTKKENMSRNTQHTHINGISIYEYSSTSKGSNNSVSCTRSQASLRTVCSSKLGHTRKKRRGVCRPVYRLADIYVRTGHF